jgi:hypothetical protein
VVIFLVAARRTAALHSAPNALAAAQCPLGDGRLRLVPERRAARQCFRPSAFAELPTTAKPRTVGRVSGGQFARSPRRSRVRAEYRAHAARPVSIRRVNRPPGADWAPRAQFGQHHCHIVAACGRPLARWPAAIDGELGAGTEACRAATGARRRLPRCAAGPELDNALARALITHLSARGWRAARGWPAGAASLWPRGSRTRPPGRAAVGRRGAGVALRGARRCAAATHPYWCARAAACPPRPPPRSCSSLPPPPPPRPVSCTFPSASLRRHRAAHHPTDPLISRPVRSTHPTNRANTRALTAAPNAGSSARLGERAPVLHHAARELGHSSERGSCSFLSPSWDGTQACISAALALAVRQCVCGLFAQCEYSVTLE